jgi:hypothetical protein
MAKRRTKVLRARKAAKSDDDDSLLTKSAESLRRVIGSLRRKSPEGATARTSAGARKTARARKTAASRRKTTSR